MLAFLLQLPAAASVCVATLDLHVKTIIYSVFLPPRTEVLIPLCPGGFSFITFTLSARPQPLPFSGGYAVSCRFGPSPGGSPEGKPGRKVGETENMVEVKYLA